MTMIDPTTIRPSVGLAATPAVPHGSMDAHIEAAMLGQPDEIRATLIPIASGGKRLRARMARAASRMGTVTPDEPRVEALTASIELLHLATLVHDDLIDGDVERRGHPSLFAAFDEGTSIVAGDRIIGNAFALAARVSGPCAARMAQCLMALCDGQQHEELCVHAGTWTTNDYWRAVDGKTASLFAFSLVAGGELAEADAATLDALDAYGMAFGRAYQLADDLVDLPSTPPGRQLVRALAPSQPADPFVPDDDLLPLADLAARLFADAVDAARSLPDEPATLLVDLARSGHQQAIRIASELGSGRR